MGESRVTCVNEKDKIEDSAGCVHAHDNAAALLLALLLRGGGSGGLVAGHELLT
jgi:hypothetical protein